MQTADFQLVNKWPQRRGVLVANLASKKHNSLESQTFLSEIQHACDEIPETHLLWESMFISLMWTYLDFFDKVLTPLQWVCKPKLSYQGVTVLTQPKEQMHPTHGNKWGALSIFSRIVILTSAYALEIIWKIYFDTDTMPTFIQLCASSQPKLLSTNMVSTCRLQEEIQNKIWHKMKMQKEHHNAIYFSENFSKVLHKTKVPL